MTLIEKAEKIRNGIRILSDWLGDGAKVIDKESAQSRANVCLNGDKDKDGNPSCCRFNQPGNMVTKAVAWAIKEQTDLKSELGLVVSGEKSLNSCCICSCWLRLKIWIPMEKLRAEETDESLGKYPEFCWMRNET